MYKFRNSKTNMSKPFIAILKVFIITSLILAIIVSFTILIKHRINTPNTTEFADKIPPKEEQIIGIVIGYNSQVKEIQQILKNADFDPGPVDGRMGNRTRQAIKKFQEAKGLQPTGKIDEETMLALNKEKT